MLTQPYLHFDGRCGEAINFYTKAIGAKCDFMIRYRESPEPTQGVDMRGKEDWVMHSNLRIGDSVIMASDDCTGKTTSFQGFQLSLMVDTEAEAKQRFAALAEGGQVRMPLTKTFFSASFGMLSDHFGVPWMVLVTPGTPA